VSALPDEFVAVAKRECSFPAAVFESVVASRRGDFTGTEDEEEVCWAASNGDDTVLTFDCDCEDSDTPLLLMGPVVDVVAGTGIGTGEGALSAAGESDGAASDECEGPAATAADDEEDREGTAGPLFFPAKQSSHTFCFVVLWMWGSISAFFKWSLHINPPHLRQWCLRFQKVNACTINKPVK
jgi:hypothetical protein